jgi:hypothetical protein
MIDVTISNYSHPLGIENSDKYLYVHIVFVGVYVSKRVHQIDKYTAFFLILWAENMPT